MHLSHKTGLVIWREGWKNRSQCLANAEAKELGGKQNRNFRPKGEGRSGRRPLLPKRKLNILVDLTLGKSYHSVVTFLHAQKIKCYTFSIQTSSKLISYYVCLWKVGPWVSYFFIRQCRNRVAKYLWSGGYQA